MNNTNHKSLAFALIAMAMTVIHTHAQFIYTPYAFTNFAGLPTVPGTNDGTLATARFNGPTSVAVDTEGNVYAGDGQPYATTIRKITPAGEVTSLAGIPGQIGSNDGIGSEARFSSIANFAVDSAGSIYLSDLYNNTIRKVTPDGTNWVVTTLAGSPFEGGSVDGIGGAARFGWPHGVAVDTNGNIYVVEHANSTIRKITPERTLDGTNWVVTTLAGLAGVTGSADGTNSTARFDRPAGIAIDRAANLYVSDSYNNTIRKITPHVTPEETNWVVTTLAGLAGTTGSADGTGSAARFNHPRSVAVDSAGNVYVPSADDTIRKITPAGVVTTLAGLAGTAGSADGIGSEARFYGINDVAVDNTDCVYVADAGNHRITKGTPWRPDDDLVSSIYFSAVDICWAGRTNQMYQVQYRTDLSDTNWFDFGSAVLGTGTNCVTDVIGGISHRFYRITRVP